MIRKGTANKLKQRYGKLKYNNVISYVDGKCMRSKKERKYYEECKLRKKACDIKNFQFQVRFNLPKKEDAQKYGIKPIVYVLDFLITHNDGSLEYVDVKGCKTDLAYRMFKDKQKLMKYFYDIDVKEV